MKETKALGDQTLAQSQKITLFAVLCPGDGFAGSALPTAFYPLLGGKVRDKRLFWVVFTSPCQTN